MKQGESRKRLKVEMLIATSSKATAAMLTVQSKWTEKMRKKESERL